VCVCVCVSTTCATSLISSQESQRTSGRERHFGEDLARARRRRETCRQPQRTGPSSQSKTKVNEIRNRDGTRRPAADVKASQERSTPFPRLSIRHPRPHDPAKNSEVQRLEGPSRAIVFGTTTRASFTSALGLVCRQPGLFQSEPALARLILRTSVLAQLTATAFRTLASHNFSNPGVLATLTPLVLTLV
jgi:hypothetical protein